MLANSGHNLTELLETCLGHVMVAERDVQVHVARRTNVALGTRANCTKHDFATIEAERPGHRTASRFSGSV